MPRSRQSQPATTSVSDPRAGVAGLPRGEGAAALFASAYVSQANRLRAEAAQPLGWISKPIEMGRFVAVVDEALERLRSGSH